MLTLRNPMDRKPTDTTGIRTAALLGQAPLRRRSIKIGWSAQSRRRRRPSLLAAPCPKIYTVEAIRAAKRSEEVVR